AVHQVLLHKLAIQGMHEGSPEWRLEDDERAGIQELWPGPNRGVRLAGGFAIPARVQDLDDAIERYVGEGHVDVATHDVGAERLGVGHDLDLDLVGPGTAKRERIVRDQRDVIASHELLQLDSATATLIVD